MPYVDAGRFRRILRSPAAHPCAVRAIFARRSSPNGCRRSWRPLRSQARRSWSRSTRECSSPRPLTSSARSARRLASLHADTRLASRPARKRRQARALRSVHAARFACRGSLAQVVVSPREPGAVRMSFLPPIPSARSARRWLPILLLGTVVAAGRIPAQGTTRSADARLRALYTAEWTWREREMSGSATRFARVDAASQQTRLAYWTRALATLDSIPRNRLSPEERINAEVFAVLDPCPGQRHPVPDVRGAVQQRHLLLVGVHAAPGLRDRRGVPQLHHAAARHAAVLRRADDEHARGSGARVLGATGVGGGARPDDRAVCRAGQRPTRCSRHSPRCRRRSRRRSRPRCAPRG